MNIKKGKIIELEDNNEYYVLDKISLDGKCYLYLSKMEPTSDNNLCFVELKNNLVFPITDNEIVKCLFNIVNKND